MYNNCFSSLQKNDSTKESYLGKNHYICRHAEKSGVTIPKSDPTFVLNIFQKDLGLLSLASMKNLTCLMSLAQVFHCVFVEALELHCAYFVRFV